MRLLTPHVCRAVHTSYLRTHVRVCCRYLNCIEHALGMEDWAKSHNATVIATDDKEGDQSSTCLITLFPLVCAVQPV